jgi:DNA-directed RNA polymerase specialized sigma24 family protein
MAQETDLQALTLSGLAQRCARETELFFARCRHDPRYCFEIFRRAVVEGCQQAWAQVYAQYSPLVTNWVHRHIHYPDCGEETPFLVNRAFEKMWAAMTSAKFSRFPDLKSVLRYLQMCAHSVVIDELRKSVALAANIDAETLPSSGSPNGRSVDDHALTMLHYNDFWDAIGERLHNEKERYVVYGSYILGLKPRQLIEEYRYTFHDVREIYRIKENVLARLRRDAELKDFLYGHT